LTLVRLLQMRAADVTVFERDASAAARLSGSSLDIDANSGRKAIRAAGLDDAFRRVARQQGEAYAIADESGKIALRIPAVRIISRRPEIARSCLRLANRSAILGSI
jgi:hypothetical protein